MPVDCKNIVFGGILDFDCPMREHLNHNITVGPRRPKFAREKMKHKVV